MTFLLCIITTLLVAIADKGIPIKLDRQDIIIYFVFFMFIIFMTRFM
jgi:hypothetical protein